MLKLKVQIVCLQLSNQWGQTGGVYFIFVFVFVGMLDGASKYHTGLLCARKFLRVHVKVPRHADVRGNKVIAFLELIRGKCIA
jgi:hypothetical protein